MLNQGGHITGSVPLEVSRRRPHNFLIGSDLFSTTSGDGVYVVPQKILLSTWRSLVV